MIGHLLGKPHSQAQLQPCLCWIKCCFMPVPQRDTFLMHLMLSSTRFPDSMMVMITLKSPHGFWHLSYVLRVCPHIEKEKESRLKLDALKVQMQFIAEYGRHLVNIGVSICFFFYIKKWLNETLIYSRQANKMPAYLLLKWSATTGSTTGLNIKILTLNLTPCQNYHRTLTMWAIRESATMSLEID